MTVPAVRAADVSKRFRLYHERPSSLKERVVNWRRPRYEEFWALRGVSLSVDPGQTVGLIGPNGSGKSTLLKIVAGIMRPTSGTVETRGRIASLLELGAGFHPELTGRENVFMNSSILGISRKRTERYFDEIVAFSELENFIDMQVRHYSSGMFVRLGFAVAVHVDPDVLIVDEVLAVGDEAFQRKCIDRIRTFQREGRTILFVTHAVDLVRHICDHAYFLNHGELVAQGEASDVIRAYRQVVHGEAHLEARPQEERGSGEIRIADVRFLDRNGLERAAFKPGEQLDIVVTLQSVQTVEDPVTGIAIYDERDACIFGTNTAVRGLSVARVDGKLRIHFRIPALPILDGSITVSAGVIDRDERHVYHWREKAFGFKVVNDTQDVGSANFAAVVEIEAL